MMCTLPRTFGIFAIIPVSVFLALSFIVLVAARKAQEEALKTFGYAVVILLWLASLLIGMMGLSVMATGKHPIMQEICKMSPCMAHYKDGCGKKGKGMMYGSKGCMKFRKPSADMSEKAPDSSL